VLLLLCVCVFVCRQPFHSYIASIMASTV
jgi:hypothetical protein